MVAVTVREGEVESAIAVIAGDLRALRRAVDCLTLRVNIIGDNIDEIAGALCELAKNWRVLAVRSPTKNKFVAFLLCCLYS